MKSPLGIVSSKLSPLSQIILLFHFSTSRNPIYIFLVILVKYFAITSIVSSFAIEITSKNNFAVYLQLLQGTSSYYLKSISLNFYFLLSAIVFVNEIIFSSFLVYYIYIIKAKKILVLNIIPKFCFISLL